MTGDSMDSKEKISTDSPRPKLILASSSPRRRELLEEANIPFEVRKPTQQVDERLDDSQLAMPIQAVQMLAERKAAAVVQDIVAQASPGMFLVLGADTMVIKDGQIFGKPKNLDDAKRMLSALSGDVHQVITGVSLWQIIVSPKGEVTIGKGTFADRSDVTFKELSDQQIADYLREGESFDKAGAYAIQGKGAKLVERYEGNLDNIIGLPVGKLLEEFPDLRDLS